MQLPRVVQRAFRRSPPPPEGLRAPPMLDGGLPLVGHTVEFARSAIDLLFRAQRECGEVARLNVATKEMYGVFGPEIHEAIFRAPDSQLNPCEAYKIMTPVFGKNMVYDAPPARMNEQLKMLLPALKDRRMRTYGQTIVNEVNESIADWGDEGVIDLVDYCRVLTNYTSAHCLLGREFRKGMTNEFAEVYHALERGVTPVAYLNAHLPLPSFRARDRARARLVEMIGGIIEERRRVGRQGEDFLQTLMDASYKSGVKLTDDEITGMLLASMFAGHHTSSVTTAWSLLELVQHPQAMKLVVDQLDATFGEGRAIDFGSLREINETEWAVKEALRLHPPLFMLVRVVMEDFQYKDYHFPKGSWLIISPTVAHQIEGVFTNARVFDPQRYAPGREEDKRDYAYIAFGAGRHKCMGNAFALLQVKAILAILLRNYEFELTGDPVGSDFHGLVVGPSEPCRIRYRRRKDVARANGGKAQAAVVAEITQQVSTKPFEVRTDTDLCQSHAVCMGEAPDVFKVTKEGKVNLLVSRPPVDQRAKCEAAAKYCPTGAIRVVDLDN